MNAVLLEISSTENMKLLLALADKLGIKAKSINDMELEDFFIAEDITKRIKTAAVSKESVMNALQTK